MCAGEGCMVEGIGCVQVTVVWCAGDGCMVEGIGCVQVTVVWWRV